jgi:hypothetical protein
MYVANERSALLNFTTPEVGSESVVFVLNVKSIVTPPNCPAGPVAPVGPVTVDAAPVAPVGH